MIPSGKVQSNMKLDHRDHEEKAWVRNPGRLST